MRAAQAAILAVASELGPVDEVIVGAAGALAAPDAARALGDALLASLRVDRVAVTSDAVIAHAGALNGEPGVVLIVGTGVVALAIGADGALRTADGWGPWLGDEGGGAWIGAAGLRAALRAHDGRGPSTTLLDAARAASARRRPGPRSSPCRRARVLRARRPRCGGRRRGAGDRQRRRRGARRDRPRGRGWPGGDGRRPGGGLGRGRRAARAARPRPGRRRRARRRAAAGGDPRAARDPRAGGPRSPCPAGLDALATEAARPDLDDLDARPIGEVVALLVAAEGEAHGAVAAAVPRIAAAAEAIAARLERGGRLIYAGAGTPGRLGVLDAAECGPTFGTDLVRGVIAGGPAALTEAIEGAEDAFDPADLADLTAADALVGITASGRTPYVLGALEHARAAGALTVAIVNNPGSEASADLVIELLTGPRCSPAPRG